MSLWAGLPLDRPKIMGILNITPDSFSDGGVYFDHATAIDAGLAMLAEGADIIDVGGESTRPGARAITAIEEQARIIPVIRRLAQCGALVSVDSRNALTMIAALDAGARIVNDVSALNYDPEARRVVADSGCPVVLMHMRGTPETMLSRATYKDVVAEVMAELSGQVEAALSAGIRSDSIAVDPGIGFAKTADQSVMVLRRLDDFKAMGYPVVVGVSRKSFIGRVVAEPDPARRLGGSLAAALFAVQRGASIVRVHNVCETVQALRMWHFLRDSRTVSGVQERNESV